MSFAPIFTVNDRVCRVARTPGPRTLVSSRFLPSRPLSTILTVSCSSSAFTLPFRPSYAEDLGCWDVILGRDVSLDGAVDLLGTVACLPLCDSYDEPLVVPPVMAMPGLVGCPLTSDRDAQRMCLFFDHSTCSSSTNTTARTPSQLLARRAKKARYRASARSRSRSQSAFASDDDQDAAESRRCDPTSSSFASPVPAERDGKFYIDALLSSFSSQGITADPFCADLQVLRCLLDGHGLTHLGICHTALSCRSLLFRHLASGECVANRGQGHSAPACQFFSRSFQLPSSMSNQFFASLARASPRSVDTSRLASVASALEMQQDSSPRHFRQRLQRLFHRESDHYLGSKSSGPVSQIPFVLKHFHSHALSYLVNIATKHGLSFSSVTATPASIRRLLTEHFVAGGCLPDGDSDSPASACSEFVAFVNQEPTRNNLPMLDVERTLHDQLYNKLVFSVRLLTSLRERLQRSGLFELLEILDIPTMSSMTTRNLQSLLYGHIQSLRAQLLNWEARSPSPDVSVSQLDEIQKKWPSVPTDQVKNDCIQQFRDLTSLACVRMTVCASCSATYRASEMATVLASDLDMSLFRRPDVRIGATGNAPVDPEYAQDVGTDFRDKCPWPAMLPDVMLDPEGVFIDHTSRWVVRLCKDCRCASKNGRVPALSLCNHNYIGPVPPELRDLSFIEEQMIALCRAKVCILKMTRKDPLDEKPIPDHSPMLQRELRGNMIIFPQDPSEVASILPPSVEEMKQCAVVIFIGNTPPTKEWLLQKAVPLAVRPDKVRRALLWLKTHNRLYKDIEIDNQLLDSLPSDFVLPVDVETHIPTAGHDITTSRYDLAFDDNVRDEDTDTLQFDGVVMTNFQNADKAESLKVAAARHVKEDHGAYLSIPHGVQPENEFYNRYLFPSMYPTLYPFGLGGFENTARSVPLSLQRQVRLKLSLNDRRFQTHHSFLFIAFNLLQRREVLLRTSFKVKKRHFEAFAEEFANLSPLVVHTVSEKLAANEKFVPSNDEEKKVVQLMEEVNALIASVPGSASSKKACRNEIRALMIELGLPSFFVTINPADMFNPLVKILAGDEIDPDALRQEDLPQFFSQSCLVARNPAVGASFFDIYMQAFISALLHYTESDQGVSEGVLGHVSGYYGMIEAQGRGTLHCHMLVWMHGALDPNELKERVLSDPEFQRRMVSYLDDSISTSIPQNPLTTESVPSDSLNPRAIRGLPPHGEASHASLRRKDLRNVCLKTQVHKHTSTCYKYCRGKRVPQVCRFKMSSENTEPNTYFDAETGELFLRNLDGLVNNYNDSMLEALRNNMDIKFIGSGTAAKAVLYYITDYITKTPLKAHVAYAALELAINRLGEPDNAECHATDRARSLLHKCAFAMVGQQEMSAQQVMSYLMSRGDHYTSHTFKGLYWPSALKYVRESFELRRELDSDARLDPRQNCGGTDLAVEINGAGHVLSKVSQLEDYMFRGPELRDLCYWDFVAQVDKERLPKKDRVVDTFPLVVQEPLDAESEYAEYPAERDVEQDEEDSGSESSLAEDGLESQSILQSTSRTKQRFRLDPAHPEYTTHQLALRRQERRFVPVPIGPPLPRRDREDRKEEYAQVMLLLFKPWSFSSALLEPGGCWLLTLSEFLDTCPKHHLKRINNMQILHECKDSRDDNYNQRRQSERNANYNFGSVFPGRGENLEPSDGPRNLEELLQFDVLQRLLNSDLRTSRNLSDRLHKIQQTLDNLVRLQVLSADRPPPAYSQNYWKRPAIQVASEDMDLETEWADMYSSRRRKWKENAASVEQQAISDSKSTKDARAIIARLEAARSRMGPLHTTLSRFPDDRDSFGTRANAIRALVLEKYPLNLEQLRAFDLVFEQLVQEQEGRRPLPLHMYVGGPGGTGKSTVINALTLLFSLLHRRSAIRTSAFTGVAAKNIGGMTLHTALSMNVNKSSMSKKARNEVRAMWRNIDYLVINEISMIGTSMLARINDALCIAKESPRPFGGLNVIFAGDFGQLPPVGDKALYQYVNPGTGNVERGQRDMFGKLLWYSVRHVVLLTKIMRQKDDPSGFVELLHRARIGQTTQEDFELLKSRVLSNLPLAKRPDALLTPILTSTNDAKDRINERAAENFSARTGEAAHWYFSHDRFSGSEIPPGETKDYLDSLSGGKVNYRLGRMLLAIGMPVMLCQNCEIDAGVVNGAIGILKDIRYTVDDHGRRHMRSCIVASTEDVDYGFPGLAPNEFPVVEDSSNVEIRRNGRRLFSFSRTQIPLVPAFAMTVYKVQGRTLESAIINLNDKRSLAEVYVMLSRVKSLDGLYILDNFDRNILMEAPPRDVRSEYKRLKALDSRQSPAFVSPRSAPSHDAVQPDQLIWQEPIDPLQLQPLTTQGKRQVLNRMAAGIQAIQRNAADIELERDADAHSTPSARRKTKCSDLLSMQRALFPMLSCPKQPRHALVGGGITLQSRPYHHGPIVSKTSLADMRKLYETTTISPPSSSGEVIDRGSSNPSASSSGLTLDVLSREHHIALVSASKSRTPLTESVESRVDPSLFGLTAPSRPPPMSRNSKRNLRDLSPDSRTDELAGDGMPKRRRL